MVTLESRWINFGTLEAEMPGNKKPFLKSLPSLCSLVHISDHSKVTPTFHGPVARRLISLFPARKVTETEIKAYSIML